jgi:GT2 family glycosyltransferase
VTVGAAESTQDAPGSQLTSAITVSFNSGPALDACVESVLGSTVPVEMFVVDNGSDDRSLEAVRTRQASSGSRLRIIENGRNLGFSRANNRALAQASGDCLLFLNPDCIVQPDTIESMRRVMNEHAEAGMAGCLILNPDGTEQPGCRRESPTPGKALVRAFRLGAWLRWLGVADHRARDFVRSGDPLPAVPTEVDAISGAFMFVRRSALERVGPLDEGYFLHCEDLDWCERFRRAGYKVLFVPHVTITHAKGGSSGGRPVRVLWHMHRGMIRFYRKFFLHAYPRPLMWLVVCAVWLRFAGLAALALARSATKAVRR